MNINKNMIRKFLGFAIVFVILALISQTVGWFLYDYMELYKTIEATNFGDIMNFVSVTVFAIGLYISYALAKREPKLNEKKLEFKKPEPRKTFEELSEKPKPNYSNQKLQSSRNQGTTREQYRRPSREVPQRRTENQKPIPPSYQKYFENFDEEQNLDYELPEENEGDEMGRHKKIKSTENKNEMAGFKPVEGMQVLTNEKGELIIKVNQQQQKEKKKEEEVESIAQVQKRNTNRLNDAVTKRIIEDLESGRLHVIPDSKTLKKLGIEGDIKFVEDKKEEPVEEYPQETFEEEYDEPMNTAELDLPETSDMDIDRD